MSAISYMRPTLLSSWARQASISDAASAVDERPHGSSDIFTLRTLTRSRSAAMCSARAPSAMPITAAVMAFGKIADHGTRYSGLSGRTSRAAVPSTTWRERMARYSGMKASLTTTSLLPVPERPHVSQLPSMIS